MYDLFWNKHTGAESGALSWVSPAPNAPIGKDFSKLRDAVVSSEGVFYGRRYDGALCWRRHVDWTTGNERWFGEDLEWLVGSSWDMYSRFFASSGGTIYGQRPNGELYWYRHLDPLTGGGNWLGGKLVGSSWDMFSRVFAGPEGVLYGVMPNGELRWYKHLGWQDGSATWAAGSGKVVGSSWDMYVELDAGTNGVIYGRTPAGLVYWYKHLGWHSGDASWHSGAGLLIHKSWGDHAKLHAVGDNVLYCSPRLVSGAAYTIRSVPHGKFVSKDGDLYCNRDEAKAWETFRIDFDGATRRWQIVSYNDTRWSVNTQSILYPTCLFSTQAGVSAYGWQIVPLGGDEYAFYHVKENRWLTAEPSGVMAANRTERKSWETFTLRRK